MQLSEENLYNQYNASNSDLLGFMLTQDSDPAVPPACGHGRAGGPDPGQRIVPLHRRQAGGPVVAAAAVDQTVQAGRAQTGPLGPHGSNFRPLGDKDTGSVSTIPENSAKLTNHYSVT